MKLELKHLAHYLPYEAVGRLSKVGSDKFVERRINGRLISFLFDNELEEFEFKPILRPMSDIANEITINGGKATPGYELSQMIDDEGLGYNDQYMNYSTGKYEIVDPFNQPQLIFEQLVAWNFDVFGLIHAGLAIDINSLQEK